MGSTRWKWVEQLALSIHEHANRGVTAHRPYVLFTMRKYAAAEACRNREELTKPILMLRL